MMRGSSAIEGYLQLYTGSEKTQLGEREGNSTKAMENAMSWSDVVTNAVERFSG